MALSDAWRKAPSREERARIWDRILRINADQVFTIGVVAGVLQPVVVARRLRNMPDKGMFNWEPGAHFGIYRMDGMWFDGATPARTAAAAPKAKANKP